MRWFVVVLLLILFLPGCSTRGLNDHYASVTEQRLVTQSLDQLIRALPEQDFERLRGQTVFLQAYFIEQPSSLTFALQRLKMELQQRYACQLVERSEDAAFQVHFFFNAIGSDQDSLGLSLPEIYLPVGGVSKIDFLALEMFHGVSEGYYYIVDSQQAVTSRGELLKARVRTDRLKLPFFSIPLNTLD